MSWRWVFWGLVSLTAILIRVSTWDFFSADFFGHFNFFDTDSYYHLKRLFTHIANYPAVMVRDGNLDWPEGAAIPWSELLILLYGFPAWLFGVESMRSMELYVGLLSLLFGLVLVGLSVWVARALRLSFQAVAFCGALFSLNSIFLRNSVFGSFDHHLLEILFAASSLLFLLRYLDQPKRRDVIALAISLFFGLYASATGVILVGAVILALSLLGRRSELRHFLVFSAVLLGLTGLYAFINASFLERAIDTTTITWIHFALILFGLIAGAFCHLGRRFKTPSLIIPILAISLMLFFSWPFPYIRWLETGLRYIYFPAGLLSYVSEASSVFHHFQEVKFSFFHVNFGYLGWLVPLGLIWLIFRRKHLERQTVGFLIVFLFVLVPGLIQKRFSHLAMLPYLVFLGVCLDQLLHYMKEKHLRLQWPVVIFSFGMMVLPQIGMGFVPGMTMAHRVDFSLIKQFKKHVVDSEEQVRRRILSENNSAGVWVPINIGHSASYVTGYPSLSNSYYHPWALDREYQLRTAKTTKEFVQLLRDYKLKYIIIVDDFDFFRILTERRGEETDWFYKEQLVQGVPQRVFDIDRLRQFAFVRILFGEEKPEELKELEHIQFEFRHWYQFARIFEVKPSFE